MSNHITPTPGRIVWYRGADGEIRPAIVIKGNGPFNADLHVFPLNYQDTDCGIKPTVTHADPEQEPGCLQSWHWMPYQKQQAEKAADREHDAKQLAVAADRAADARRLQAGILDMALRTPGLSGHYDVLAAAKAYQGHIDGEATAPAPQQLTEGPAPGAAHADYSMMLPHQQRVIDEKAELEARLVRLVDFTRTPFFAGLDAAERNRLDQQVAIMAMYSDILTDRIAAFTPA